MRSTGYSFLLAALFLSLCAEAFAMTSEPTRLVVWKRGETIAGEEFLTFDEATVDYLSTLKRPTEPVKAIKYNCLSKSRAIRPSVQGFNGATPLNNQWVEARVLYELKDCVEVP